MKRRIILGPIIFIFVWFMFSLIKIVNPILFPSPIDVIEKLFLLLFKGEIWSDLFATCYRLILGFLLAVSIGTPLGLILGYFKKSFEYFEFIIDFFRSIPASALFPMFLLFFGIGDKAKLSVVIFSCSLIIIIYTIYGVKNCNEARIKSTKVMKASNFQIFIKIIFPESFPHIFAGLRISISIALILVVVTEMFIGTRFGLGKLIYDSHLMFQIPKMYSIIILTGVIGYLLNKLFLLIEKTIFHWEGH